MKRVDRLPDGATWTGKVRPEDLTAEERVQIRSGTFGYCETHGVLYRKPFLISCLVPLVIPDGKKCLEWLSGPKEWSPRRRCER